MRPFRLVSDNGLSYAVARRLGRELPNCRLRVITCECLPRVMFAQVRVHFGFVVVMQALSPACKKMKEVWR